jgi:type VI secretion system protein VasD
LEKRTKKLLSLEHFLIVRATRQRPKVFWCFFSKKNCFLLFLASCASAPPPPPPTVIHLTISAGPLVNPGPDGRGAPVTLRLYQLSSASGFGNAEFFALYTADAATLGSDIARRDDVILAPSQTVTKTLSPRADVTSLGVFAGYRDFQRAAWRAVADIAPHQTTNVTITAGAAGIVLQAAALPPPAQPGR